jgi:Xaa-Pro aminopeptidase
MSNKEIVMKFYDEVFNPLTAHGVGLDIHENPRLSPANPNPLAAGSVVSVEPGLYDPSWGGIRLEDIVVVRQNNCECLTQIPTFLEIE